MATERQPPDAVLASSELSGGLTDIDEDPDAPDGNWMIATSFDVNTSVRVSFPTPTGDPTVGADLQQFKAFVRQFWESQTGTPTARLELWENGALVRLGSYEDVLVGGTLISLTWNANELATPDGTLVECRIAGKKSGGGPPARNSVDMGAVEWNVTYSLGATVTLEGQSDGSSVVGAALSREVPLGADSDGVCTATATLETGTIHELAAAVDGAAVVSAGVAMQFVLAAEVAGLCTVTPTLLVERPLEGAAAGIATVAGELVLLVVLGGTADGACTVAGTLTIEGEVLPQGHSMYGLLGGPVIYQEAN